MSAEERVASVLRERMKARAAWIAKGVELMDAYREAEVGWHVAKVTGKERRVAADALLNHAYNEGKAP